MMTNWLIPVGVSASVTAAGALAFLSAEHRLNKELGFALLVLGPATVAAAATWRARRFGPYLASGVAAALAVGLVIGVDNAASARDNHPLVVLVGTAVAITAVAALGASVVGALLAVARWRVVTEPSS